LATVVIIPRLRAVGAISGYLVDPVFAAAPIPLDQRPHAVAASARAGAAFDLHHADAGPFEISGRVAVCHLASNCGDAREDRNYRGGAVYQQRGEFSAAVELRRRFPGITDNAQAQECARTIAGWKPLPLKELPKRPRLRRVR
jgi:hypothetical protein